MVFVTAEIGINHNGSLKIAKKLIDIAKNAGCDAVKFQKRTVDLVYDGDTLNSPRESPWGTTTREQKNGLEFSLDDYKRYENSNKVFDRVFFIGASPHYNDEIFDYIEEKLKDGIF